MTGHCVYFVHGECRAEACVLRFKVESACKKNGLLERDVLTESETEFAFDDTPMSTFAKTRDQERNRVKAEKRRKNGNK